MNSSGMATAVSRHASVLVLSCLLASVQPAAAADNASEHAQLAVLVRQLDMLDRLADQSARLPSDDDTRYHFDYARLHADIARMRSGIQDYLSPPRAQPRDPAALLGNYRTPNGATGASP